MWWLYIRSPCGSVSIFCFYWFLFMDSGLLLDLLPLFNWMSFIWKMVEIIQDFNPILGTKMIKIWASDLERACLLLVHLTTRVQHFGVTAQKSGFTREHPPLVYPELHSLPSRHPYALEITKSPLGFIAAPLWNLQMPSGGTNPKQQVQISGPSPFPVLDPVLFIQSYFLANAIRNMFLHFVQCVCMRVCVCARTRVSSCPQKEGWSKLPSLLLLEESLRASLVARALCS